jgi:hypothetical protein
MITPLEQYDDSGDQTPKAYDETYGGHIPVIQVHGQAQRDHPGQQVKIRQAFVNWFGDPHIDIVSVPCCRFILHSQGAM